MLWTPKGKRIVKPSTTECTALGLGLGLGFGGGASAVFTPLTISAGLALALDAAKGCTVSSWLDQSGAGDANRNAVQASGALQPVYSASDANFNALPSLAFSGSQLMLTGVWSVAIAQPFTTFAIARCNTAGKYLLDALSGAEIAQVTSSVLGFRAYAGSFTGYAGASRAIGFTNSIIVVESSALTATSVRVSQNTPDVSGANNGTSGATGLTIGNTTGGTTYAGWTIAELYVWSRALTDPECAQLNAYANTKYGIPIGA